MRGELELAIMWENFKNPWKAQTFVQARLLGYLLTIFIEIYS